MLSKTLGKILIVVCLLAAVQLVADNRASEAGAPTGLSQPGEIFLINSYTDRQQTFPSIGMGRDGRFTVTWTSDRTLNGGGRGPHARQFDASATALSEDFHPAGATTVDQRTNDVAQANVGGQDITLFAFEDDVSGGGDVYGRALVDGSGEAAAPVVISTTGAARSPHAFVTQEMGVNSVVGGFVWEQLGVTTDHVADIYLRRVEVNTQAAQTAGATAPGPNLTLSAPLQVNEYTTGNQRKPAACVLGTGDVAVVWLDYDQSAVVGKLLTNSGATVASEFQIATGNAYQIRADVCCSDNRFVVTWDTDPFTGPFPDGDAGGILARIYDQTGQPLAPEFLVNTYTPISQNDPHIACDSAGNFVVAWGMFEGLVVKLGSKARSFDADGTPYDAEDYDVAQNAGSPHVALSENGVVTAVWSEATFLPDAHQLDIIGQRIAIAELSTPAVCGDPVDPGAALTSAPIATGELITASDALFTLNAAVGAASCLACVCDVNGDGSITATDALLILSAAVGIDVTLACPAC